MYRRILASQEDKSVDFIAIGPLNNLSNLLNSNADEYSPLDGIALVKRKVQRLVLMAGIFNSSVEGLSELSKEETGKNVEDIAEFNAVCDIPAAQNVAEYWPTPKVYLGFEAGLIRTGKLLHTDVPENNPVRIAYRFYTEDGQRYSCDLLTVEYAIVKNCCHYKESGKGKVTFDDEGRTKWILDKNGLDCYVEWAQPSEKIAEDINNLLITPPRIK